ncbi:hypothetical protein KG112_06750 [Nocardioides sp. zg-ZUI104]|uniref:hypothetical protein n=1 Tax=Nocardioides faecalis TaxID=2803858 RepID=UPI001BCAF88A|nr:hypothetical protein [Nocardioides faecalis]MBS4752508.1 hypothetical protein [Nocardioides faecalis]
MDVHLAWASVPFPDDLVGPWVEVRHLAEDLVAVESTASLSRVYHELKWSLPEDAALIVAPLAGRPKLKGLRPGTTTWLRDRLAVWPGPDTGSHATGRDAEDSA